MHDAAMGSTRLFTLEEANALVPKLDKLIGRQMERRTEIEEGLRKLAQAVGHVPRELAVADDDSEAVRRIKVGLLEEIAAYESGWQEVAATGAIVKDTQTGLIDFYGRLDGRTVFFCWRYGERRVEFFHELDAGFPGRKSLDAAARQSLLN
jgi:hypothetical protein